MPIEDTYSRFAQTPLGSGHRHQNTAPDDTLDLPFVTRLVFIGTGGHLVARDRDGRDATYKVTDGTMLPICITRILATGTTAADIVVID